MAENTTTNRPLVDMAQIIGSSKRRRGGYQPVRRGDGPASKDGNPGVVGRSVLIRRPPDQGQQGKKA